jgi:hypothetical protein
VYYLSQSESLGIIAGFCIAAPLQSVPNMLVSRICLMTTINTQTWFPKNMHGVRVFSLIVCAKEYGGGSTVYQP